MSTGQQATGDRGNEGLLHENHYFHQEGGVRVQVSASYCKIYNKFLDLIILLENYVTRFLLHQLFPVRFSRATRGKVEGSDMPGWGLVRDGTSCGDNLVIANCVNYVMLPTSFFFFFTPTH